MATDAQLSHGLNASPPICLPSHRVDATHIKLLARGHWVEILANLSGIDREILDARHHPCPKCGGTDRFRMIDFDAGALLCNVCFKTGNGDGLSALQWLTGKPFRQVLEEVAEYLAVTPLKPTITGQKMEIIDPAGDLRFIDWSPAWDDVLKTWCDKKRPIIPAAVKAVGGKIAKYRNQHSVITFPILGSDLNLQHPTGWIIYHAHGGSLPKWRRSHGGELVKTGVKVKLTAESKSGLLCDPSRILSPTTRKLWKVEGITDLLAVMSLTDAPIDTAFITNACGTSEQPADWVVELFANKTVYTLHDSDEPGRNGAKTWSDQFASRSIESRLVTLPYPVEVTKGRDVRDYLTEMGTGHNSFKRLSDLASKSKLILPPTTIQVNEAVDDPHRLARVVLTSLRRSYVEDTLRLWQSEWYRYTGTHYQRLGKTEFIALVSKSIKTEFDRVNLEDLIRQMEKEKPPMAHKVTTMLVNNVIQAMSGMVLLDSQVQLNTWLDDRENSQPNRYIALQNGILDVDAYIASGLDPQAIDQVLLPHTPNWFGTYCLPYNFDPAAQCSHWEEILSQNLESDLERIKMVQEWSGYLLFPDTSFQKFMALEGDGSNGKSVYLGGINALLGQANCSSVALEDFGARFDRYSTLGKLVNISADAAEIDKAAEGTIKAFTSGDLMHFDRKGLSPVEARPTARLMVSFNSRPRFSDRSNGIWRRMILIPWRREVPEDKRVLGMDLPPYWAKHNQLSGMFNWALAGLVRLRQQQAFTSSRICRAAIDDYRLESNPTRSFLSEHCERRSESSVPAKVLYAHYRMWCHNMGNIPLSDRQFGKEVRRVFKDVDRRQHGSGKNRDWHYESLVFDQTSEVTQSDASDF